MTAAAPRPTAWQVRRTRAVVAWYLERHYGAPDDPGARPMFYDRDKVGPLAVTRADLRAGKPAALFRVLVACAMFQRRQDVQIMRILRGLPAQTGREAGSQRRLLALADASDCPHLRDNDALLSGCDLGKDPRTKAGTCGQRPGAPCHLKRHTEDLKRYGHFGKVPTSIALAVRGAGARDLRDLYRKVLERAPDPAAAAADLELTLGAAWRVSQKIACMFLSVAANPSLGDDAAPWASGVDWQRFVVIDSNVDLYLAAIGYPGPWTYDARRAFVQALAARVDLSALRPELPAHNARLVQQAAYLFMSETNRRALPGDCQHDAPASCSGCGGVVRALCTSRA